MVLKSLFIVVYFILMMSDLILWCAEKKLPYTATYIEEGDNKPDWYFSHRSNRSNLQFVLKKFSCNAWSRRCLISSSCHACCLFLSVTQTNPIHWAWNLVKTEGSWKRIPKAWYPFFAMGKIGFKTRTKLLSTWTRSIQKSRLPLLEKSKKCKHILAMGLTVIHMSCLHAVERESRSNLWYIYDTRFQSIEHMCGLTNSLDIPICRGINIFQAFTSYLKSKKADDQSKEELLKELAALNEHLKTKVHRLWLCSCLDEEKMKLKLPLAVWEWGESSIVGNVVELTNIDLIFNYQSLVRFV